MPVKPELLGTLEDTHHGIIAIKSCVVHWQLVIIVEDCADSVMFVLESGSGAVSSKHYRCKILQDAGIESPEKLTDEEVEKRLNRSSRALLKCASVVTSLAKLTTVAHFRRLAS